jgi:radical SAM protein with 4Fe4S-binding SPASM domain
MDAGIRKVRKFRSQTGKSLPWLIPLVTVSAWNADKLDRIVDVAQALGADGLVVYYSWFTTEAIGNAHTRVFEKKLGITPTAWRGYLFNHNVDIDALKQSLVRIRRRRLPFPVLYIPDLTEDQLEAYYRNPGDYFGFGPCISPWTTIEVMPNGDITPCRDYSDYVAGSILDAPIEHIWNGDRYVKFRKALVESGGTFPICARCCGLMGW